MIPVVILFTLVQRYLTEGLRGGSHQRIEFYTSAGFTPGSFLIQQGTWAVRHTREHTCMLYYVEAVLHRGLSASAKKANTFSRGRGNLIVIMRTWSVTWLIVVSLEIKSR